MIMTVDNFQRSSSVWNQVYFKVRPVPSRPCFKCLKHKGPITAFLPAMRPQFPLQKVTTAGSWPFPGHLQGESGSVSSVITQMEDSN